ncbi:hypothetical protein FACS1894132_02060 [Clostridia bacterium]|nr:hypothetical protein FACS1894132_02060 [Clostridia bacterium]
MIFEKPTKDFFKSRECILPEVKWTQLEGEFEPNELIFIHNFLMVNRNLITEFANEDDE